MPTHVARSRVPHRVTTIVAAVGFLLAAGVADAAAAGPEVLPAPAGAHGIVRPRGTARPSRSASSPQLVWHGGQIMTGARVTAIYWGTTWTTDSDKVAGMARFYRGLGGSPYMDTNTEYSGTNGTVSDAITYEGSILDTRAAPRKAPSVSAVLAEVASQITDPMSDGYYPVYSDQRRGSAQYCAWHSYGTIAGTPVQIAFFFNLDGDAGCDPKDPGTVHSQGLEAVANVSGHEISEAVTDPRDGGWYDKAGAENADKCAWTFDGLVTLGGEPWKVQGNWSNEAYVAGTGYTAGGCIQTKA